MWRSKAGQLKTTNLCNEFLVIYLTKKKHQLEKHGLQRKAMVYATALVSIKKYPLPIIAELQLKTLYGVGDLLCEQLAPVIRYHYRQFLKQKPQKNTLPPQAQQNQFDDEETLKSKCRSLYSSNNNEQTQLACQSSIADEEDTKSNYSMQSASVNKPYKPRPKTQAANIILAMKSLSPQDYISTDCLKEYFKNQYKQLLTHKQYCLLIDNLVKQGYAQKLLTDQSIKLSRKGNSYALILQGKTKAKDSQVKIKSMIMEFKSNINSNKFANEQPPQKIIKNKISTSGKNGLVLIIDSRQVKDKNDQSFFQCKLTQKYAIECRTASLPIGDFLWTYQDQVLDYIVERKKADDLASSIYDGRYKEQKLRLKNSKINNIFYLFQGHLTGTHARSEREVEAALINTRVRDQFKVVKVVNINQSLKFISFLTQAIAKQLDAKPHVQTLGTLQEFSDANGKSSNLTVQQIFGLSLKTIPGVGKASVNEVLKFFSSFRGLYNQLGQFSCRSDRIQFLKQLLKGCGVRSNLPQLLNDVLFGIQSV